jgi:hypothetical protein
MIGELGNSAEISSIMFGTTGGKVGWISDSSSTKQGVAFTSQWVSGDLVFDLEGEDWKTCRIRGIDVYVSGSGTLTVGWSSDEGRTVNPVYYTGRLDQATLDSNYTWHKGDCDGLFQSLRISLAMTGSFNIKAIRIRYLKDVVNP